MLYTEFLKTMPACPFCGRAEREIVKENDGAVLKYALAPYAPYHLLVCPKRHVTDYLALSEDEQSAIDALTKDGARALVSIGITDYSILVRNGDKTAVGKSVDHLHFHIVPKVRLGTIDLKGEDRRILSDDEIAAFVGEIKKHLV